jgi:hypothetical protein
MPSNWKLRKAELCTPEQTWLSGELGLLMMVRS